MKLLTIVFAGLVTLSDCGDLGQAGDAYASDDDCDGGLECHIEDHGDEEEQLMKKSTKTKESAKKKALTTPNRTVWIR